MGKISSVNAQLFLVAYFDIFGFSNITNRSDKDHIESILRVWDWINKNIKKELTTPYLFSDCGFLVSKVDDSRVVDCFIEFIQCLIKLMDRYLDEDYFIRGGISYGEIQRAENLIVGEPVREAVKLESKICPGPFIILPVETRNKLIKSDSFMNETRENKINLKSDSGRMLYSVIFPLQKGKYIRLIKQKAQYHLEYGPAEFGKFWDNILSQLMDNFPNLFKRYNRW